jgi:hypothetical protein
MTSEQEITRYATVDTTRRILRNKDSHGLFDSFPCIVASSSIRKEWLLIQSLPQNQNVVRWLEIESLLS